MSSIRNPHPPRKFSVPPSKHRTRRMSNAAAQDGPHAPSLTTMFVGISAVEIEDRKVAIALAAHDTTYLVDFTVEHLQLNGEVSTGEDVVADYVLRMVQKYEHEHYVKIIGAGIPIIATKLSPALCSRLWLEADIIPIVFREDQSLEQPSFWEAKHVDEQADSMARKCIMCFGPSFVPLLQVGWQGAVQVDAGFKAQINTAEDHQKTVSEVTWKAVNHFAQTLKDKKTKIAFFSATPQGGGVALMRHALVRFSKLLGVDLTWYVPKPRPGVFRSTKNMHNILQGVAEPDKRLSDDEKNTIRDWIVDNAKRYWLSKGGPLRPSSEGGADIIVIDDPQMPGLIPLIKEITPDRPVLYRSHIQIRSDLVAQAGSPQEDVWKFLWNDIRHADMFISHPIPEFVPENVPHEKVAYLPATTDWYGLNKPLNEWDSGYYGNNYNIQCKSHQMTELNYPKRKYIVQIARFDPAKGITTVVDSYAEFRIRAGISGLEEIPQLVIAGNSSVDDPDGNMVYDQALDQIEKYYPHLSDDISVMRLDANDQLLNCLIAKAHVVLQLSTREGFEVKVSEALHAGRPVIATLAGGIPLQVKDEENGFLVEPDDYRAVAQHLHDLFADDELWKKMSHAARTGVSDEVSTPGNALAWYYLAAKWSEVRAENSKATLKGEEKWVNDMAREESGYPYEEGENRLPRKYTQKK
ncbi:putative Glycosyltransferase family 4 protein [Seiridium unicorne]|uniref:Glycosyltransferase family 4 protein n=1 Tax=Seiridium unicorne TaxID=138068 RepID=A0ABR2VAC0_9PEZI